MNNSRAILGVVLVIIGGLFLIDNFGIFYFDFGYLIFNWGSFFLIVGILILAKSSNSAAGWIFLSLGGIIIAGRIFDFSPRYFIMDFWPLLLIGLGLYVLLNKRSSPTSSSSAGESTSSETTSDTIDEVSIFYGSRKVIQSAQFRGGKITTIFGSAELDLTNAKLADGYQVIDVLSIFGGSKLFVKQDLKVDLKVVSLFGGFSDKRIKASNVVPDQSRTLVLKGLVIFGGGDIRNYT